MVSVLDFVFLGLIVLLALIGARVGILNMIFVTATIYLTYLLGSLFARDLVDLIQDNFAAVSGVDSTFLLFITYVVFLLLLIAIFAVLTRILRKFLKVIFLGWIDRLGGGLIGGVAAFAIATVFTIIATWTAATGIEVIGAIDLVGETLGVERAPAVDTVDRLVSWLDRQVFNSFTIRNIIWPAWSILDALFPSQLFGIPLEQVNDAIDALSNR